MTHANTDARFWDRIARRYAGKAVPDPAAYETKLNKTSGYLKPTDQVLEIGCGSGSTALYHSPQVDRILATDFSTQMIDVAREKARQAGVDNVSFQVSSIEDLACSSMQYDVVMAHNVLHLVANVPQTLHEIHKMLKPGGLMISSTQCIGDSAAWFGWVAPLGKALRLLPRVNVFRETDFFQWIGSASFDIEEVWQAGPKASHYVVAKAV
ncbi:MAG: class I SAM-dependent methyltransferase [Lysobacterales bacterium]